MKLELTAAICGMLLLCAPAQAQTHRHTQTNTTTANDHAPIGVMGDHMHETGEWMLSYRAMHMDMDGSRKGKNSIDPDVIATTIPNPFTGPPTLRVVPTDMTMDMHMIGLMYAPTNWLTLTAMGQWLEKEMSHITYAGMAGTTVRGTFTTKSDGWGDTKLGGLFRLYEGGTHDLHLNLTVSVPTGSIKETARILAPTGATPVLRMPYGMQLGTGTYDLLPGLTYQGYAGSWNWGAQFSAEIRLQDENEQNYSWGNRYQASTWGAYEWADWVSTSLRLTGWTLGDIDGNDPLIAAPVQTASPDNYGGDVIEAGLGFNFYVPRGPLEGHRLAIEATAPLYRDLNGPQLETDWTVTLGWQFTF